MNSRGVCHGNNGVRGFTLIELLLVIALVVLFGAVLFPIGISSYQSQVLSQTKEEVIHSLRFAQTFAMSGKHDSAFGIKIVSEGYILFEGNAYTSRVEANDEFFSVPGVISFSGIDEIVFTKLSGTPSITGTIIISSQNREEFVRILPGGVIE